MVKKLLNFEESLQQENQKKEKEKEETKEKINFKEKLLGKLDRLIEKLDQLHLSPEILMAGFSLMFFLSKDPSVTEERARELERFLPKKIESVTSQSIKKAFEERFDLVDIGPSITNYRVLVTGPAKVLDSLLYLDPGFPTNVNSGHLSTEKERKWGVFMLKGSPESKAAEKMLLQYQKKFPSFKFQIDSLEIQKDLYEKDYQELLKCFFNNDKSFFKMLALIDKIHLIYSSEEERKMPEEYGIEGYKAAHFRTDNGKSFIEIQRKYIEEASLYNELDTFFHELGHAFDPCTPFGIMRKNNLVEDFFEKSSFWPKYWKRTMIADQELRNDSADTIFSYSLKIENSYYREAEDFAESFTNYFLNPIWLYENAPNRFKAIDEMIKVYLEDHDFNVFRGSLAAKAYLDKLEEENLKRYDEFKKRSKSFFQVQ